MTQWQVTPEARHRWRLENPLWEWFYVRARIAELERIGEEFRRE